jgi:Spy/CpxP family protein refolding chaperone
MKTPLPALVAALTLFAIAPARAQQATPPQHYQVQGDDPLAQVLFPPELIMQHQQDIDLRPEQRTSITKAIQDFQTKAVDLQWRLQEQSQRLVALLQKPTVDQAAALTQVDSVLSVEREVKRAHIALLIQIKNTLSADQQAKLAQAREAGPR